MPGTALSRFRFLGWLEGVSYLLLLGVAMPLKYAADMPQAVSMVGMAHGVLFVAYVGAAFVMTNGHDWPMTRLGGAVLAAILPFGPFVFDRKVLDPLESAGA